MELVLKEIKDKISQKLALWPQVTLMTDDLKRYFDYYGFPLADHIDIKTQAISVKDYQIAVYRFRPSLNLNPSQSSQQPLRH
ncbi:alpha/beta hydrolase, partial [Bacillus halotolerans]